MNERYSKKRQEIVSILENSTEAFSASQIHKKLPHINLVTIYRNLEKLLLKNIITKLNFDSDTTFYEIKNTHQHAICNKCNKIIHFSTQEEKFKEILAISNFQIQDIEIIVRGICDDDL